MPKVIAPLILLGVFSHLFGAAPIVIGEYGSMTGETATFGTSTDNGVQMAIDEANAKGGVNGRKLAVKLMDDEGSPDKAVEVVKSLLSTDHVTAVIGEVASSRSIAVAPLCNTAGVPMISPSSTNPKVTKMGPYIFRAAFIDPYQGETGAKFAFNTLKAKRAAIVTDRDSDYSTGLARVFLDKFTKLGGKLVCQVSYGHQDEDFKACIRRIKAVHPDVIYIPGYYGQVGPFARQLRAAGVKSVLLGGDGWDSPKLVEGAGGPGKALEGAYFTNHFALDTPTTISREFVARYRSRYGTAPDSLAALGYDATAILLDAMRRAGKPEDGDYASPEYRTALRDALAATKRCACVTGPITVGPDRNPIKPAVIVQIRGELFKFKALVNP